MTGLPTHTPSEPRPSPRPERGGAAGFRVVVASDKFKGSLTSAEVAAAVGAGVRRVHPDATVVAIPVADGGDGTLTAAVAAGYELIPVVASGPTGEPVHTAYARVHPADARLHHANAGVHPADAGVRPADARLRGVTTPGHPPQPFEGISPRVLPSPLVYEGRTLRSRGYPLECGADGAAERGDPGGRGSAVGGESGGGLEVRRERLGDVAVVELADASGLVRLPGGKPAPMSATSRGTGEVIAAAIDAGCTRIILGIGGSASTDGGAGLVRALGARLLGGPADGPSASHRPSASHKPSASADRPFEDRPFEDRPFEGRSFEGVAEGGGALAEAASLDLSALRRRLDGVEFVVACDVDNPLTGPNGAAAVYGPQKGATAEQVAELDVALTRWADLVALETGRDLRDAPGAGAAGGVGFAALALLNADLRPGIELVLELVGFHEQLAGADLVITGEGALDEQTLHGKAVAGIATAARAARSGAATIPVVAVCGVNRLEPEQLHAAGLRAAYALTDLEPDVQKCIAEPEPLLERIGERIAVEHLTMTRSERGIA